MTNSVTRLIYLNNLSLAEITQLRTMYRESHYHLRFRNFEKINFHEPFSY